MAIALGYDLTSRVGRESLSKTLTLGQKGIESRRHTVDLQQGTLVVEKRAIALRRDVGPIKFPENFLTHVPITLTDTLLALPCIDPYFTPPLPHKIKIPENQEEYVTWIPVVLGLIAIIAGILISFNVASHIGVKLSHIVPLSILFSDGATALGLFTYAYYGKIQNNIIESDDIRSAHYNMQIAQSILISEIEELEKPKANKAISQIETEKRANLNKQIENKSGQIQKESKKTPSQRDQNLINKLNREIKDLIKSLESITETSRVTLTSSQRRELSLEEARYMQQTMHNQIRNLAKKDFSSMGNSIAKRLEMFITIDETFTGLRDSYTLCPQAMYTYYESQLPVIEADFAAAKAAKDYQAELSKLNPFTIDLFSLRPLEKLVDLKQEILNLYKSLMTKNTKIYDLINKVQKARADLFQKKFDSKDVQEAYLELAKAESELSEEEANYAETLLQLTKLTDPKNLTIFQKHYDERVHLAKAKIHLYKTLKGVVEGYAKVLKCEESLRITTIQSIETLNKAEFLVNTKYAFAERMLELTKAQAKLIKHQHLLGKKSKQDVNEAQNSIKDAQSHFKQLKETILNGPINNLRQKLANHFNRKAILENSEEDSDTLKKLALELIY